MAKYVLSNPERKFYFVQSYWDGSYSAIQAETMDEAMQQMLQMTDFELAVDKRRFWQGMDKEEACSSEIAEAGNKIIQLSGEDVLRHAREGHQYPIRWEWVKVVDA